MRKQLPKNSQKRHLSVVTDLTQIQTQMSSIIMRPLTPKLNMQRRHKDGRSMYHAASTLIKPSSKLSSFARLEIYNCQYWFRVIDSLHEDFPGLKAVLGEKRFHELIEAYLIQYPSSSFTLRNLGSHMPQFLQENPKLTKPHQHLALDMARFEWTQVVAFDGEQRAPLDLRTIHQSSPDDLTISLQPYISLLELDYPLDDFDIALKSMDRLRTEAGRICNHSSGKKNQVA